MSGTEAVTDISGSNDKPQPHRRQSTLDDAAVKKLETQLKQRPERDELEGKNILKRAFYRQTW